MKLLQSTKSKIDRDKNGKTLPNLEISEVVLAHRNAVKNDYQQDSRVLYTFIPNKSFGQLLASQYLPVKSYTRLGCKRFSRIFKKKLARRQLIVLVHLVISSLF